MTDQELTSRLQEVLEAAHRRYRKGQGGFGALVTPPLPAALIDQVAAGLAPVLRGLVAEAVAARLDPTGRHDKRLAARDWRVTNPAHAKFCDGSCDEGATRCPAGIAPTDLRPGRGNA